MAVKPLVVCCESGSEESDSSQYDCDLSDQPRSKSLRVDDWR